MKKNLLLFLSLFSSSAMLNAAESSAKRRKLFDLPAVIQEIEVEEISDIQLIECRYCFEPCAGLKAEKVHIFAAHKIITGDVHLEGRGIRYTLPAGIRRGRRIVSPTQSSSSASSDSGDDVR